MYKSLVSKFHRPIELSNRYLGIAYEKESKQLIKR